MKIRSGFVSNSSSSSFIIGVGIVRPGKEKEAETIFGETFSLYDCIEYKYSKGGNLNYETDVDSDSISVSSAHSSVEVSGLEKLQKKLNVGDIRFVFLSDSGDEPEYDYDSGQYNYDSVDIDWFDKTAQKRYESLENTDIILKYDRTLGGEYAG